MNNDQQQEQYNIRHQFCEGYPNFEDGRHVCCSPNQKEADFINHNCMDCDVVYPEDMDDPSCLCDKHKI